MKLNESTFRRILREESIKFLREESTKPGAMRQVWDATKQAFDPNFVSSEDNTKEGSGALDVAGAGVQAVTSGFDPAAQVVLVGALSSYIRASAVKQVATSAGVGAPTIPGLVANAAMGGEAGAAAVAAAGGGATGVALGILAPVALGMLGTYMLGRIASEGWIAYKVGNNMAERSARMAFQTAVTSIYTAIINRAIGRQTFKREQIIASGAPAAVPKFARSEALTASEQSIVALMFSGTDELDFLEAQRLAFGKSPAFDGAGMNVLTDTMKVSATKIYRKTLEDLFSKLSSQIKEFQAAAKASAAEITAKQQAKAKDDDEKRRAHNAEILRKADQDDADRADMKAGRVPSRFIGPGSKVKQ